MENPTKTYFDDLYTNNNEVYSMQPDFCVRKVLEYIQSGKAADFGAGEGRNSLFLAKNGFGVDASDFSDVAITKLNKHAKDLSIHTEVKDLADINIQKQYDVIVASLILHFVKRDIGLNFLRDMQTHTKVGGFNCIRAKMQVGHSYEMNKDNFDDHFYIAEGELQQLYDGWEILEYAEANQEVRATNQDGSRKVTRVARMLARKLI